MSRSELSLITCPMCANFLPNTASFCTYCNTQLSRCPICTAPVSTGPTTCSQCGTKLSLPIKAAPRSDSSTSMLLPGSTILFRPEKVQENLSTLPQLESLVTPLSSSESPDMPSLSQNFSLNSCPQCHYSTSIDATFCANVAFH
jgi:hypothetical protein